MPASIHPQLSGQILSVIASAQDNDRLLEVSAQGYVQEASKFKHFVVAVKSFFTGEDYKAQSHDAAKAAFISRLKSDVLATENNGLAVWEQLQDRVRSLHWSPGLQGLDFNANEVLNELEKAFGEINLKHYEFTRSAGEAMQTSQAPRSVGDAMHPSQTKVVVSSGKDYYVETPADADPKYMEKRHLPEIQIMPGLYGADSAFGFQTQKAQDIYLEKYSAAEGSGLPTLLLNNRDKVAPKTELALMTIYAHDHLLESALKSAEADEGGVALDEEEVTLNPSQYLTILYNLEEALQSKQDGDENETPINHVHDLLNADFESLTKPTQEFSQRYYELALLNSEASEVASIDEGDEGSAEAAVVPEKSVSSAPDSFDSGSITDSEADRITAHYKALAEELARPQSPSTQSRKSHADSVGADSFDAVSITDSEDAAVIAANLAAFPHSDRIRGASELEQSFVFQEVPSFEETFGAEQADKSARATELWNKVKQSVHNGDFKKLAEAFAQTEEKRALSDAEFNAKRDLEEKLAPKDKPLLTKARVHAAENNPEAAQEAKLEEAITWKSRLVDLIPAQLKLQIRAIEFNQAKGRIEQNAAAVKASPAQATTQASVEAPPIPKVVGDEDLDNAPQTRL